MIPTVVCGTVIIAVIASQFLFKESISAKFTGDIKIISRVENWQGTGKTFEYYQRDLGPKPENKYKNNPPLVENV